MYAHMRRRLRRLGFIAAVLGVFAALAPAASANVTGTVVSGTGAPLYGVSIRALDAAGAPVSTSDYTDGTGAYDLYISTS